MPRNAGAQECYSDERLVRESRKWGRPVGTTISLPLFLLGRMSDGNPIAGGIIGTGPPMGFSAI